MEISPIQMLRLVMASLGFGIILGIFFDFQRMFCIAFGIRKPSERMQRLWKREVPIIKKNMPFFRWNKGRGVISQIASFFQDLTIMCVAAVGVAIIGYTFNDGKLRLYPLLGVAIGFFLYYFFVSKFIIFLFEYVYFFFSVGFFFVFWVIFAPIFRICLILVKKMNKLLKNIHKALAKRKEKVYNLYVKNYLVEQSKNGFINRKNGGMKWH